MQQYDEYKDSGVEWIGKIPEGWDLRRISSLYDMRNEKVSDQDYPALSVTMQGVVPQLETAAKSQDGDNRKLVKAGDFVINSRSDRRGACGISELDGSVTLISNVLVPREDLDMVPRYYSYLFRSEGFADEYYRQGTGIVDDLWSTNWTRMKNILVACPPLVEQRAIADYLDVRTTEIDRLVADCEREVELLREYRKAVISEVVTKGFDSTAPMKDSGIEWIGEIPESWAATKLQRCLVSIEQGWSPPAASEFSDDWWSVISLSAIREGRFYPVETKPIDLVLEIPERLEIHEGDLLMTRSNTRELVGDVCLVTHCRPHVIFPDLVYRIGLNEDVLIKRYAMYSLISELVRRQLSCRARGSSGTMPKINHQIIKQTYICLPPLFEQRDIADYLDGKTAEIDSLIADKRAMIDKLREYRKAVISEAVMGKFKVPSV